MLSRSFSRRLVALCCSTAFIATSHVSQGADAPVSVSSQDEIRQLVFEFEGSDDVFFTNVTFGIRDNELVIASRDKHCPGAGVEFADYSADVDLIIEDTNNLPRPVDIVLGDAHFEIDAFTFAELADGTTVVWSVRGRSARGSPFDWTRAGRGDDACDLVITGQCSGWACLDDCRIDTSNCDKCDCPNSFPHYCTDGSAKWACRDNHCSPSACRVDEERCLCPCEPVSSVGACCTGGSCTDGVPVEICIGEDPENPVGVFFGDGSVCGEVECPEYVTGACCLLQGATCTAASAEECAELNGVYHGAVTCDDNPCVPGAPGSYFFIGTEGDWWGAMENIQAVSIDVWQPYMDAWAAPEEGPPYPENTFVPAKEPTGGLYIWTGPPESETQGTGLVMHWDAESAADGSSSSAWMYALGAGHGRQVPVNLSNMLVSVTVTAPQFDMNGNQINVVSFGFQDAGGNFRAWYWNVGPAPAPIPWWTPVTITINTALTGVAAATPIATSYMDNGFNILQAQWIIVDENTVWIGGPNPIPPPGGPPGVAWNYWYNLSVAPSGGGGGPVTHGPVSFSANGWMQGIPAFDGLPIPGSPLFQWPWQPPPPPGPGPYGLMRMPPTNSPVGIATARPGDVNDYWMMLGGFTAPSEAEIFQSEPDLGPAGSPAGTNNQILQAPALGLSHTMANVNAYTFGEDFFNGDEDPEWLDPDFQEVWDDPWEYRDFAPGFVEPLVAGGGQPIMFHFSVDPFAIGLPGTAVQNEATLQGALFLPAGPLGSADPGVGTAPWQSDGEACGDVFFAAPITAPGVNFLDHDEAPMALLAPRPIGMMVDMEDDIDAMEHVGTNMAGESGNTHDRVMPTNGMNGGLHPPDLGDPFNPNHDPANTAPVIFSVDRGTTGAPGSAVAAQVNNPNDGASGDLFIAVTLPWGPFAGTTTNMLLVDDGQLGLMPHDDLDAVIVKLTIDLMELEWRIDEATGNFNPDSPDGSMDFGFTMPLLGQGEAVVGFSVDLESIGLLFTAVDFECRVDGLGLAGPGFAGSGVVEQAGDIFYADLLPPPGQMVSDLGTGLLFGQNYLWFEEMAIGLDRGAWTFIMPPGPSGNLADSADELNALDSLEFIAEETEACCLPGVGCSDVPPTDCMSQGGMPHGPGSACSGVTIACCRPDGTCLDTDPMCCDDEGGFQSPYSSMCLGDSGGNGVDDACECQCNGDLNGDGVTSIADFVTFVACIGQPPVGACASSDINCDGVIDLNDFIAFHCLFYGGDPAVCCQSTVGACCLPNNECRQTTFAECIDLQGTYHGDGTACGALEPQACCLPDGTCQMADPLCCEQGLGGDPQGEDTNCQTISCVQPAGACCDHAQPGGVCVDGVSEIDCLEGLGFEQPMWFPNMTCAEVEANGLCEEHTGACCDGTTGICEDHVPESECPVLCFGECIDGSYCDDPECCIDPANCPICYAPHTMVSIQLCGDCFGECIDGSYCDHPDPLCCIDPAHCQCYAPEDPISVKLCNLDPPPDNQYRWEKGMMCVELDPPCEEHTGACCDGTTGMCEDNVPESDCPTGGGGAGPVTVVTEIKSNPLCSDALGPDVPEPLEVCNVYVHLDPPASELISVGFADITTSDSAGFYQHPIGTDFLPPCFMIPMVPDLVCDSFVTVGLKCWDNINSTFSDCEFDSVAFNSGGQVVGGWSHSSGPGTHGLPDADGNVLVAQLAVRAGQSIGGIFKAYVRGPFGEGSGPCPDLNGDGFVGAVDLASLLGACGPNPGHPADLNGDGVVDAFDLAYLLAHWGPCNGASDYGTFDVSFNCFGLEQYRWEKGVTCDEMIPPCEEHTGACCDGYTGVCNDSVPESQCPTEDPQFRWEKDTPCSELVPPCEEHTGACCDGTTGVCQDNVPESQCPVDPSDPDNQYRWEKGVSCSELVPPCEEHTGACCDGTTGICLDDVPESECPVGGGSGGIGICENEEQCVMPCPAIGACVTDADCGPGGHCLPDCVPSFCTCDGNTWTCTEDCLGRCAGDPTQVRWEKSTLCVDLDPPCTEHTGACCDGTTGICEDDVPESQCPVDPGDPNNHYRWEKGVPCSELDPPCEAPLGACCFDVDDGPLEYDFCVETDEAACLSEGGIFEGAGTVCTSEACCLPSGYCQDADPECCVGSGGAPQGFASACTVLEPCCFADGACEMLDPLCCTQLGGGPSPTGADQCMDDQDNNGMDDACEQPQPIQACCLPAGDCVDITHNACVAEGGDPQGPGVLCDIMVGECHPLKWAQPPTFNPFSPHPECFWGWDEFSVYGILQQIIADDWLCEGPQPIVDVHWWGSYMDWEGIDPPEAAPGFFHIGIWTDVPAGSDQPFSHPGVMLHEWVAPRAMLNERPVACDFHPAYMADPDGCFRYDFVVPEGQWFYQEGAGNIYWLSISAMYAGSDCECNGDISGDGTIDIVDVIAVMAQVGCPVGTGNPECDAADVDCDGDVDQHDVSVIECQFGVWPPEPLCCSLPGDHAWGWKTREHFYSDDAVRIFEPFAPVPGSEYTLGEPIEDPSGASWDMAFVLTTLRTTCPADISGDGIVDAFDLALLLGAWGPCPAPCMPGDPEQTCSEDLSGDCMVGAFDLATLLGAWGPCCGDGLCRPEELCGLPYECELDCGPCP